MEFARKLDNDTALRIVYNSQRKNIKHAPIWFPGRLPNYDGILLRLKRKIMCSGSAMTDYGMQKRFSVMGERFEVSRGTE